MSDGEAGHKAIVQAEGEKATQQNYGYHTPHTHRTVESPAVSVLGMPAPWPRPNTRARHRQQSPHHTAPPQQRKPKARRASAPGTHVARVLGACLELKVDGSVLLLKPRRAARSELCHARLQRQRLRVDGVDRRSERVQRPAVRRVGGQVAELSNVRDLALHRLNALQDTWQKLQAGHRLGDHRARVHKSTVAIDQVARLRAGLERRAQPVHLLHFSFGRRFEQHNASQRDATNTLSALSTGARYSVLGRVTSSHRQPASRARHEFEVCFVGLCRRQRQPS